MDYNGETRPKYMLFIQSRFRLNFYIFKLEILFFAENDGSQYREPHHA